jgi:cell division protein ZapD
MLRLEHLFDRLGQLLPRDAAVDHHFALVTMFEIMDVAARADLKSDLLKELERHGSQLQSFRGHPGISEEALDAVTQRIQSAFAGLNQLQGKAGHTLTQNEWLMSVRSRISIPGGTCAFDLPAYFAWQQHSAQDRRTDLRDWTGTLAPLSEALTLLLGLLRETGSAQRMVAPAGHYQQGLVQGKTYQLLRVRIDAGSRQCEPGSGSSRLDMRRRLTDAGVTVAGSDCGFGNFAAPAACGYGDTRYWMFDIDESQASLANSLGFLPVDKDNYPGTPSELACSY